MSVRRTALTLHVSGQCGSADGHSHTAQSQCLCCSRTLPQSHELSGKAPNPRRESMTKKTFVSTALVAALLMVFCLPGAAQQVYLGVAQAGVPPLATQAPCIPNSFPMPPAHF